MSYTAHDEDVWIMSQFPRDYAGWAADVGAWDGVESSNTYRLELAGWKVLCVEPNPNIVPITRSRRERVVHAACADHSAVEETFYVNESAPGSFSSLKPTKDHPIWHPDPNGTWAETPVRVATLDQLLEEADFPELNVLSIDTEGTEMDVLRGITLSRWRPKVVVVESWNDYGPERGYMADHGYKFIERRQVNNLYVKKPSA